MQLIKETNKETNMDKRYRYILLGILFLVLQDISAMNVGGNLGGNVDRAKMTTRGAVSQKAIDAIKYGDAKDLELVFEKYPNFSFDAVTTNIEKSLKVTLLEYAVTVGFLPTIKCVLEYLAERNNIQALTKSFNYFCALPERLQEAQVSKEFTECFAKIARKSPERVPDFPAKFRPITPVKKDPADDSERTETDDDGEDKSDESSTNESEDSDDSNDQGDNDARFQCTHCAAKLKNRANLAIHIRAEHENKLLSCPQHGCSEKFKYPHNVKDHIIYDHPEVDRIVCQACTREFLEPKGLRQHKQFCKGVVIPRRVRKGKELVGKNKRQGVPKKSTKKR